MKAYAIGILTEVQMNQPIIQYLKDIDQTLLPFDGHFIVHGASPDILEGPWEGDTIIIEFPSREKALAWYQSEAYQSIASLRKDNSKGRVIIIEGVDRRHRATDILQGIG